MIPIRKKAPTLSISSPTRFSIFIHCNICSLQQQGQKSDKGFERITYDTSRRYEDQLGQCRVGPNRVEPFNESPNLIPMPPVALWTGQVFLIQMLCTRPICHLITPISSVSILLDMHTFAGCYEVKKDQIFYTKHLRIYVSLNKMEKSNSDFL